MSARQLIFEILANDKGASETIRDVGEELDQQEKKWSAWQTAGVVAGGAILAAAGKLAVDGVAAYRESASAQASLQFAFERFPALADTNIEALQDLNAELLRKTGIDDDATSSAQAHLAQFELTGQEITALTPLMQDLAVKQGIDVTQAAEVMGKAILGQGRALKDLGIDFEDTGSSAGNYQALLAGLSSQVGGYAQSQADAEGSTVRLEAQMGELQELVGSQLVPALDWLTARGVAVTTWMNEHKGVTMALGAVVVTLAGALMLASQWQTIHTAAIGAAKVATGIATAAQWAWNSALSANPIALVVLALAGLVAGIVWAWNNVDWFRNGVTAAWSWITEKTSALVQGVSGFFGRLGERIRAAFQAIIAVGMRVFSWTPLGMIVTNWDKIIGFLRGLPARVSSAVGGLWNGFSSGFRTVINRIIGWWNNLSFTVGGGSFLGIDIPSFTVSTPNVPYLARGGVATAATLAVVGEGRSSEAILPFDRADEFASMVAANLNRPEGERAVRLHPDDIAALAAAILDGALEVSRSTTATALTSVASQVSRRRRV